MTYLILSCFCLGKVLRPLNVPCGIGYIRRVFQINGGMIPEFGLSDCIYDDKHNYGTGFVDIGYIYGTG